MSSDNPSLEKNLRIMESCAEKYLKKLEKNSPKKLTDEAKEKRQENLEKARLAKKERRKELIEQYVEDFENKAISKTSLLSPIKGGSKSCSFGHIFARGYSTGYY